MFRLRMAAIGLFLLVFTLFLTGVGFAWWNGALNDLSGVSTIGLGALAIISFFLCLGALDSGEGFVIESHWGGLGGGVGGWRVSPPVVFLIAALAFAGATAVSTYKAPVEDKAPVEEATAPSENSHPPVAEQRPDNGS